MQHVLHARAVAALVRTGPHAALRLAELRGTTTLKLPDCCAVLAAQESPAELLTFDDLMAGTARRLGIAVAS